MAFESINDFLAMGGHGFYVWLAYGATTLVLVGAVLLPLRQRRHLLQDLRDRALRDAARAPAAKPNDHTEPQTP